MPRHRLPGFSSNRPDGNLRLNQRSRNQFLEVPSIRGVVAANDGCRTRLSSCSAFARPCPRHGPQSLADGFRPLAQNRQRPPGRAQACSTARPGPRSCPRRGRSTSARCSAGGGSSSSGRRCASDRSLRQGEQGDTIEAIAPDAATPRSRHVARRMACGSSWTLLRIVTVAVVDVGRAQVPLGMLAV